MATKVWIAGQAVATMAGMESKPKRGWLRFAFSLRMLLILVALAAAVCWPLSQWQIAQYRRGVIEELLATVGPRRMQFDTWHDPSQNVVHVDSQPYVRRLYHDAAFSKISMPHTLDPKLIKRVAAAFPEAECEVTVETDAVRLDFIQR